MRDFRIRSRNWSVVCIAMLCSFFIGVATVDYAGVVSAAAVGSTGINISAQGLSVVAIVVVESLPMILEHAGSELLWPASSNAIGYDVVRGDLGVLRASSGDFSLSAESCVGDNVPALQLSESSIVQPGEGLWFLLRTVYSSLGGGETYDVETTGDARDTGLVGNPQACP